MAQVAAQEIVELDDSAAFGGLTAKQYAFVKSCFSGLSYAEAYRQNYDCEGMSEARARQKASELANEPLVKAKLRDLRIASDQQSVLLPQATKSFVIQQLIHLALNAEKEAVQLGAVTQLGKVNGIDAFRETTRVEHVTRTPEDVDKELLDLIARAQVIDGTARSVEPKPGKRKPKAPR
jgi:hypothetical protein